MPKNETGAGGVEGVGDAAFEAFADDDIDVGESNLASQQGGEGEGDDDGDDAPKPRKKPAAKKPAEKAKPAEDEGGDAGEDDGEAGDEDDLGGEGDDDGDEDKNKGKKKTKTPSERIRDLNKRLRQEQRERARDRELFEQRLSAVEKGGLPPQNSGGNQTDIGEAPDPTDTEKYPLGSLDDRYIEDKLEWLSEKKAADRADAVLQRQQENERNQQAREQLTSLQEKADDLAERGSEVYDDYQEVVIEAGMRGDFPLEQITFEAASEAEFGAQILYDLAMDTKEAKRVASLSPYAQIKYVQEKDAEYSSKHKPRRIPGAGQPPQTQPRGANSRTSIRPDTDSLDDFEKLVEMDAKKNR